MIEMKDRRKWKKVLTKEQKACNIMQVVSKRRLEGKHGADGSAEKSLEKEKKFLTNDSRRSKL